MDRKVIIIPPYPVENVFERVLKLDENNKPERHVIGYREFLKQNGLDYKGYEKEAAYTLSIYLISLGFICFDIEPTEISVMYLPQAISTDQYSWYKKNKKNFRKYNLAIIDKNEVGLEHYDENILCGEKPYNKLRDLIEEKEIVEYKEKKVEKCIKKWE